MLFPIRYIITFKTLSIAGACFEMWPVRLLERKLAELPAKLREAAIYPI